MPTTIAITAKAKRNGEKRVPNQITDGANIFK